MSELPEDIVDEAERLTRRARTADDRRAAASRERRASLLTDYGFAARVRTDDAGDVLVCYPSEWREDGTIRTERIDDTDRAVERPLYDPDADDWEAVAAHNDRIVERVANDYGDPHGATARAFADFMNNHRARRVDAATDTDIEEFRTEYFVRNAWPTDEQKGALETSLSILFDVAAAIDNEDG